MKKRQTLANESQVQKFESIEEAVKASTIPLWNMPYEKQVTLFIQNYFVQNRLKTVEHFVVVGEKRKRDFEFYRKYQNIIIENQ